MWPLFLRRIRRRKIKGQNHERRRARQKCMNNRQRGEKRKSCTLGAVQGCMHRLQAQSDAFYGCRRYAVPPWP